MLRQQFVEPAKYFQFLYIFDLTQHNMSHFEHLFDFSSRQISIANIFERNHQIGVHIVLPIPFTSLTNTAARTNGKFCENLYLGKVRGLYSDMYDLDFQYFMNCAISPPKNARL